MADRIIFAEIGWKISPKPHTAAIGGHDDWWLLTTWGACMPGAKEESCWGLTPETSDVISWPRVEHELSRVEQNVHFLEGPPILSSNINLCLKPTRKLCNIHTKTSYCSSIGFSMPVKFVMANPNYG